MFLFFYRFYHHTVQIQPTTNQEYSSYHGNFMQKPKSWDNLSAKAVGGYGYGYEYISAPPGHNNSLKQTVVQYPGQHQHSQVEGTHSMCGYRVHPQNQSQQPQQQNMVNCGNGRKAVYHHYGMKGAATNTDNPAYSSMPCQHVHAQQQQQQQQTTTTSTTIITSSLTTHNNKSLDMVTKCVKGDQCTASGCPGNVSGGGCTTAKK